MRSFGRSGDARALARAGRSGGAAEAAFACAALLQQTVTSATSTRPKPVGVVHWRERTACTGVEFTAEEIGMKAGELYALDDPQTRVYVELHHNTPFGSNVYVMANTSGVFTASIPTAMIETSFFQTVRVLAWAAGADTSDSSQAFYDHDMSFVLQ